MMIREGDFIMMFRGNEKGVSVREIDGEDLLERVSITSVWLVE